MSDIPAGWFELLTAPLGPEPPVDAPLALLPWVFALEEEGEPAPAHARAGPER